LLTNGSAMYMPSVHICWDRFLYARNHPTRSSVLGKIRQDIVGRRFIFRRPGSLYKNNTTPRAGSGPDCEGLYRCLRRRWSKHRNQPIFYIIQIIDILRVIIDFFYAVKNDAIGIFPFVFPVIDSILEGQRLMIAFEKSTAQVVAWAGKIEKASASLPSQ